MTTRLSPENTPDGSLIGAAAPAETGIVHLGLGNFHRAHVAVYTALALQREEGPWGIAGFANRSHRVVDAMRRQGLRYSVLRLSDERRGAGVVAVHRAARVAAEDRGAFVAAVADPDCRILTLTISELGYARSPQTNRLDTAQPDVRADLADPTRPHSTIGMLALALARRSEGGLPLSVLSCDNLQGNGDVTRAMLTEYAALSGLGPDVQRFLATQVTFPNSMVDRIVPATTAAMSDEVERLLGVRDACPVPAEEFSMWVFEDDFAAGRPAWQLAGAIPSDEVHAYELVKLRLLNGSHSLMAYLGALEGCETIADCWAEASIREAVLTGIRLDYLPTITVPTGFDADDYVASLGRRFANRAIAHRTAQVATDGSAKLQQRIPDAAAFALDRGRMPHMLALTVAAWICAAVPPDGFTAGPIAARMREPARDLLAAVTRGAHSPAEHARAVMRGGFFPDLLTRHEAFVDRVAGLVTTIARHGARAAAAEATAAAAHEARPAEPASPPNVTTPRDEQ
ncbi:MAG TPA: mannitol dehydrogenase family protein [Microbacteriaceae bacterium]|nr:mannitol dehydrogenase family protein [Microbacteriaceae bacterium]